MSLPEDAITVIGDRSETRHPSGPPDPEDQRRPELREGAVVGRYVVLEQLGRGAMGLVVRAYDPKLRREVALKVMSSHSRFRSRDGKDRMLREARALAQLSDPHVVAVYDADVGDYGVCIAMEYVEGQTVREWLEEQPRAWPEVVDVVLAAARGLAAAHAVDVIHRDVKPDNLLVGRHDGRVRLTDFGLARAYDGPRTPSDASRSGDSASWSGADVRGPLTEMGTVLGTPAYMAPEQHTGHAADPLSDQYALCVVLWEGLYRRRPFNGASLAELTDAKHAGPPDPPPAKVPDWLRAVVRRGLAVDPHERWPSMNELADALAGGRSRARRRRAVIAFGVVALLGAAGVVAAAWDHRASVKACEEAGDEIAEVWGDDARVSLRGALLRTNSSYAARTADKVMPWIDEQAASWREARVEACLDTGVRHAWDDDMLDRSLWCLGERRLEIASLVAELSGGRKKSVERAVQAAAGLSSVAPCRDIDVLRRLPTPPQQDRAAVEAVRRELSRATASSHAGDYAAAIETGRDAMARAERLQWPPLEALARLGLGAALSRSGDHEDAETELETAYFAAIRHGAPLIASEAAEELVYLVGYTLARHGEGLRWSKHAEVAAEAVPDLGDIRLARHLDHVSAVKLSMGEYEAARELNERVLALRERALGAQHPSVASSLNNLANVHAALASYDEAARLQTRALAIWEEALGPDHPTVASILNNLAGVTQQSGDLERAQELHERALAIRESSLGTDHIDTADSLNNLAGIAHIRGAYAEAKALHERALAIREAQLGPEHPAVAQSLYGLANTLNNSGEFEAAQAAAQRALSIRQKALGDEHPEVASCHNSLGNVKLALGAYEDAEADFERALSIWEAALGERHLMLSYALVGLAEAALGRGSPDRAVQPARRALELREAAGLSGLELAKPRFALAQALGDSGRDPARARELAEQARDAFAAAGVGRADDLAAAEAWLLTQRAKVDPQ